MLRASSEQPFLPLPLRERVEVRGRHARSRHSGPYTRGIMPVLPVQTRREILPFEAQGNIRAGTSFRMTTGKLRMTVL